nr:hypothetical protein Iba_chr13cCG11890 [Ipomoea batatas]
MSWTLSVHLYFSQPVEAQRVNFDISSTEARTHDLSFEGGHYMPFEHKRKLLLRTEESIPCYCCHLHAATEKEVPSKPSVALLLPHGREITATFYRGKELAGDRPPPSLLCSCCCVKNIGERRVMPSLLPTPENRRRCSPSFCFAGRRTREGRDEDAGSPLLPKAAIHRRRTTLPCQVGVEDDRCCALGRKPLLCHHGRSSQATAEQGKSPRRRCRRSRREFVDEDGVAEHGWKEGTITSSLVPIRCQSPPSSMNYVRGNRGRSFQFRW